MKNIKSLLSLLLLLATSLPSCAAIQQNQFTTNVSGQPVIGQVAFTNVVNVASNIKHSVTGMFALQDRNGTNRFGFDNSFDYIFSQSGGVLGLLSTSVSAWFGNAIWFSPSSSNQLQVSDNGVAINKLDSNTNAAVGILSVTADGAAKTNAIGTGLAFDGGGKLIANGSFTNLAAGRFNRPVTVNADGTLSAPNWPDMSIYTFDEQFDGGNSTDIGTHQWVSTVGNYSFIYVTNSQPGIQSLGLPGYLQASGVGGNATLRCKFANNQNILFFNSISNIQGAMRIYISRTNVGLGVYTGFGDNTLSTSSIGVDGFWFAFNTRSNKTTFFFEARSNSVSTIADSTVTMNANSWYIFRYWATNSGSIYCSVNDEPEVLLTGLPTNGIAPIFGMVSTNTSAGVQSEAGINRFSFRVSGLVR